MGTMASQITSLMIIHSTVNSGVDQRKHQSSASLAFVWGIHRGPVNSPHIWPVTRKMFPFDDVIMRHGYITCIRNTWLYKHIKATHNKLCAWLTCHTLFIQIFRISFIYLRVRCLIVKSRKVLKPRDWVLKWSHRFEIWQAPVKIQINRRFNSKTSYRFVNRGPD